MFEQDDLTEKEEAKFLWQTRIKTIELKLEALVKQAEQLLAEMKTMREQ